MATTVNVERFFTTEDESVLESVKWSSGPIQAPATWSQVAADIAASRYLRKRGVGSRGGGETSVRQLFTRVARAIRQAGEWQGYFSGEAASAFEDELLHILLHQLASFNSPVYFNVGLFTEYGILGTAENFVFDTKLQEAVPVTSAYLHPQSSACFIQSVKDDLISIFDLLKSEAKLFKYGSGTGTNFSTLRGRGEHLEGGGDSTGLISYLEIYDKAAQAIKSGGTTRRAAKMVVVDADHPEVVEFIRWKMNEERKARVLLAAGYTGGLEGDAFQTVSGQNSNNSIRVTDAFMEKLKKGEMWDLKARTTGQTCGTLSARELWREMGRAAWECGDPGVQFHDTIQKWHLCPRSEPIRASNPCSEYMFVDDSACNLASLNLVKFLKGDDLNWDAFAQTVSVLLLAQDILVDYSSYPTKRIAENSHSFRPLGLGYANLGGLFMRLGIPYESERAQKLTAKITAALHFLALDSSQKMAATRGPFSEWKKNQEAALTVLEEHIKAWEHSEQDFSMIDTVIKRVRTGAARHGLRNAQVTLLAPTGTIGLLMDCDTLGIEPEFSLNKVKTLAGGGEFKLRNQAVRDGLQHLGYSSGEIDTVERYFITNGVVVGAPGLKAEHVSVFDCALPPKGHPERRVSPVGHLKIMAAAQPFLSGAISKTINLPNLTTPAEVETLFHSAWQMGLKSVTIYRDGSKALQPLCAEC